MSYAPRTEGNSFYKVISGKKFNFQRVEFGQESAYHVEVIDNDDTRHEFRMLHTGEKSWRIEGEKLPGWITGAESELAQTINEHE